MLKANGIWKKYGELDVLRGINMEVKKGEVVSVVGASGAGKSTLLHILGSLDSPDKGELNIDGNDIHNLTGNALARFRNKHIGFIFQFHNLLPEFTALENVCIPGYLGNRPQKIVEKEAKDLLNLLGLGARLDHKPSELSGGEQQRTAVARALINSPSLVMADEPSGNLDSKSADELHNLFFKLREELGNSYIIVTHNRELAEMADRRLEIMDGQIVI